MAGGCASQLVKSKDHVTCTHRTIDKRKVMAKAIRYWLMKSEPTTYSIEDLSKEKNKTTFWDGVRNYQARNIMRDEMKVGDKWMLYIPSDLAYGERGSQGAIGPNEVLIFEVELLGIQ